MGLFDGFSLGDYGDPKNMALLGMIQGLGQAAATSRLPVTTGQMFGNLAGGAMAGAKAGVDYQNALAEAQLRKMQGSQIGQQIQLGGEQYKWLGELAKAYQAKLDRDNGLATPTPGSTSATGPDIGGESGSGGGRGGWGPLAEPAIAALKAAGASDAYIQAQMAHGLAEGGFNDPWKPGDFKGGRPTSFNPWQFHEGGELEPYMAWVQGRGDPKDVGLIAQYVAKRAEELHPGITKTDDPNLAMDVLGTKFERYRGAAPGQRRGFLADAQKALGGAALEPRAEIPGVPDLTGRFTGDEGAGYAPAAPPIPPGSIQLAQNGALTSLPSEAAIAAARQRVHEAKQQGPGAWRKAVDAQELADPSGTRFLPPGAGGTNGIAPVGAPRGPLAPVAGIANTPPPPMLPQGGAAPFSLGGALRAPPVMGIDPMVLGLHGAMAETAKLPNFAKPLLDVYQMSPEFLTTKGYATAVGESAGKLTNAEALAAAEARGKRSATPLELRVKGTAFQYDPTNPNANAAGYVLAAQNPGTPEGYQLESGPQGLRATEVPGALPGITASHLAAALGPATLKPHEFFGPYGQGYQGSEAQLPQMAAGALGIPGTARTPTPVGGGLATGGALPFPTSVPPSERPEAKGPTFPVQTPTGAKDISQLTIGDMFPNGQGIPTPPAPPPGLGYGKPSPDVVDRQKGDNERLQGYNKEASENQKIYQDLGHLRDVLGRGLNTSHLLPLWADLRNVAQGLGVDVGLPKGADPNDAAIFDKAATDLVFAAVKKLAGQVRVAEIIGYQKANPGLVMPRSANYSIINDVLASGKWQDARSKLATDYMTQTGGAPLGAFDARFAQIAPLSDVTDAYRRELIKAGATIPGGAETPSASGQQRTMTVGGVKYHKIGGQWFKE